MDCNKINHYTDLSNENGSFFIKYTYRIEYESINTNNEDLVTLSVIYWMNGWQFKIDEDIKFNIKNS